VYVLGFAPTCDDSAASGTVDYKIALSKGILS